MHKLIIITAEEKTLSWKSLTSKLDTIRETLNTQRSADFTIEIEYRDLIPQVLNQRITHEWFDSLSLPLLSQGYDFVVFHFSEKQKRAWGIKPTLRGVAHNDKDDVGEAYVWANEHTKRHGENQFIQTTLHEIKHLYHYGSKTVDVTHAYHAKNPDIAPAFRLHDMGKYQVRRFLLKKKVGLLQQIVALYEALLRRRQLQPLVASKAQDVLTSMEMIGLPVRIVEGYRSMERQAELYAQGRTQLGTIVTNAKPGESFHNYGVAVDVVSKKYGYAAPESFWQTLGVVGKRHGFEWGGDWKSFSDKPHLQMPLGYTLSDFQRGDVDYSLYN